MPLIRSLTALLSGGLALLVLAGPVRAQKRPDVPVAGAYEVAFDKVSDNCHDASGMNLGTLTVEVGESKKGRVAVTMPMVPLMKGVASRGGKFKADAKRGKTAIQGVDGRFSIAGRVEGSKIQFLFIAEYYAGDKPLCTQSWNAAGARR